MTKILLFVAHAWFVASMSLAPPGGGGWPLWDKSMHCSVYAILVLLGSQLVRTREQFLLISVAIFVYSGLLEIGQHFVPGRYMSGLDLVANGLGVCLGMALALWALPGLRHTALSPQ